MPELNVAQRRAVEAGEGPVLVMAGPGTGKTKTLTARIAYLLRHKRADASHILALTFTKKAAQEMTDRVAALLGDKETAKITTFHGLCYELLDREMEFISEPERLHLIKSLPRPASLKQLSTRELGLLISRGKNEIKPQNPDLQKIIKAYNKTLREQNLWDFDDLLQDTYALLQDDEATRIALQERFVYIFVDEFQDTNSLQYELLKLMNGHDNLFVIGDPYQSIYGFRGASGTIFEQFLQDFPAARHVTLDTNYRSSPEVVAFANAIFADQAKLRAHSRTPGRVRVVQVLNEYGEAAWILREIQQAIGGGDFLRAVSDDERSVHRKLNDFAILYRSRSAAKTVQKMIDESGLPYQIVGEGSPYEKPEVQIIIALMRAAATGKDPKLEGFSASQNRRMLELINPSEHVLPSALAERIIATLGLELSTDISQLLAALVRFKTVKAALAYFDDIAEHGFYDANAEAVTLLTIHAAKGLEFPVVFLVGAEEGLLPLHRKGKEGTTKPGEIEEERRLFYVAATRAKEWLEITHAKNRGGQPASISSFIKTVPQEFFEDIVDPDLENQARRIAKRAHKRSQQSLF